MVCNALHEMVRFYLYTFSDTTVRQILILSLILAAVVFVAVMIMMICRKLKSKFGSIYVLQIRMCQWVEFGSI
jgi:hypothetical protein